ncbi:ommochrome-binding protein-like [Galleria mellonella]|uniref:Ommochrome-binding protein-like n=1 Tax=Galleria mellonella TaxID=7137 RepID=A0A6J1W702_GALME|nr:ommochrome-binding protein-like [Galleria mellonella]
MFIILVFQRLPLDAFTMELTFLLCILVIVQAGVIKEKESCEGVIINEIYHDVEVLKSELDRPYLLAIDRSTNTLYFSFSESKEDDVFKSARLDLNTKQYSTIDDVSNGFAQTVDEKTHEVYIGGNDGLYKYDPASNKAEFIGERGTDIWTIFYKDVLYYSVFPSQFLYTFSNGESSRFPDLQDTKVDHFIIDNENIMFFTNATGLYSQEKGTNTATLYQDLPENGARGMTLDVNGNVHVCYQDGIFRVDKEESKLDKLVELDDAFGVAFDKDNNIIYADATSVVRLKPNKNKTC